MPLTRDKIALLHVAKKRLGLDDATWRDLLEQVAGVRSIRDLDQAAFDRVMAALEAAGFTSDFAKANFGNRRHPDMASAGQVALIRELWGAFTDGQGDDRTLGKWLTRQGWASDLRFLAARDAQKAIGALRRMLERTTAAP